MFRASAAHCKGFACSCRCWQELGRAVEVLLKKGDLDEVLKEWSEDEIADPDTPGSGLQRSGSKEPLHLEDEEEEGDADE